MNIGASWRLLGWLHQRLCLLGWLLSVRGLPSPEKRGIPRDCHFLDRACGVRPRRSAPRSSFTARHARRAAVDRCLHAALRDAGHDEGACLRDRSLCGIWIALSDTTTENGALWVVRGSHKPGIIYDRKPHTLPEPTGHTSPLEQLAEHPPR